MGHEPGVTLLMTASGSLDIFLTQMLRMKLSVIFNLPDYKAISNTMQHQKSHYSKTYVMKEKIQTFTIV